MKLLLILAVVGILGVVRIKEQVSCSKQKISLLLPSEILKVWETLELKQGIRSFSLIAKIIA